MRETQKPSSEKLQNRGPYDEAACDKLYALLSARFKEHYPSEDSEDLKSKIAEQIAKAAEKLDIRKNPRETETLGPYAYKTASARVTLNKLLFEGRATKEYMKVVANFLGKRPEELQAILSQASQAARALNREYDVICLGEAVLDMAVYDYKWDDIMERDANMGRATEIFLSAGGSPFIVAKVVKEIGGESAFIGKVGNDAFGKFLQMQIARLHDGHTNPPDPSMKHGARHALNTRLVLSSIVKGYRDFEYISDTASDGELSVADVQAHEDVIKKGIILHLGSLVLKSSTLRAAAITAKGFALEAEAGCILSFDLTFRPKLWSDKERGSEEEKNGFAEQIRDFEVFKAAHILKFTLEELQIMSSDSRLREQLSKFESKLAMNKSTQSRFKETLEAVLKTYFEELKQSGNHLNLILVVVTCGRYGCFWRTAAGLHGYSPVETINKKVIDSLGAGDHFLAQMFHDIVQMTGETRKVRSPEAIAKLTQKEWETIFSNANAKAAKSTSHHGPYLIKERG